MIKVEGVNHHYGSKQVLEDITFEVLDGEKCGIIGRNGAGKSTLIRLMLNLEKLKKGKVSYNTIDNKSERWKKEVSYLPEKFKLYQSLTAMENLHFFNDITGVKFDEKKAVETLRSVGLEQDKDIQIHQYSKGMLQRLGLAIMLQYDTDIIILDEPTSGLDPMGRKDILQLIKKMSGKTMLMSSHHFDEVKEVCSHVILLEDKHARKMSIAEFENEFMKEDLR